MVRLPIAFLLALLIGVAAISPVLPATLEVCSTTCSDDGPDGRCAPTCFDCTCCHHVARPIAADPGIARLSAPTLLDAAPSEGRRVPASDPEDVFHVPKLDLA